MVMKDYDGILRDETAELMKLPGLGRHTASSIAAFAYNRPTVFIETNIRRVYIYEFASEGVSVSDRDILSWVAATVDKTRLREWYWAVMDYGAYLARVTVNPNRLSRQYRVQSAFSGSRRQLRGKIIAILLAEGTYREGQMDDEREREVIQALCAEGFIIAVGSAWQLKE